MGAQCVRYSPILSPKIHSSRSTQSGRARDSDEMLDFEIIISDLELHCNATNVGKVVFSVQNYLHIQFLNTEFYILDQMIRTTIQKRVSFSVSIRQIEFLDFTVTILDMNGSRIEKLYLKMHAVCEGPKHHDHLLKEMKARIIYNLEVSQLIKAVFGCSDFKISDLHRNDLAQDYGLALDMIIPGESEQKVGEKKMIFLRNPEQAQKYMKNNISSKNLKETIFRIIIYKGNQLGFLDFSKPFHQICVPYMKFINYEEDSITGSINGEKIFKTMNLKHVQRVRVDKQNLNIFLNLTLKVNRVYLQQIQCLVFSDGSLKTVSPYLFTRKSSHQKDQFLLLSQLHSFENLFKKHRKVTYQTKNQIQKNIKQCYSYLCQSCKDKISSPKDLENIQLSFLNILNNLTHLITEGEDVTNQSIWLLIDKIIHRPELSINYFYEIKTISSKTQIGLKYYGFIFEMLSKIIFCTTMGLTYHELKCIQKFIGYVYFRCKWIQDLLVKAFQRRGDPLLTNEKLIEIGVCYYNKNNSKSILYEWQLCLLPHIINDLRYKQLSNNLQQTSDSVPNWSNFLFNRDDQDLYYGVLIQIWSEGQKFLNNDGKIMWQYFPKYPQLLSTFLGQMNRNKILDFGYLFRECSMKMILNEKLLNNFVMLLFPKTCLFQINCVLNCLQLISSYFEVIEKNNKKMPNDFNFNYFYIGIRSIFQLNHSHLLMRVIGLLYSYYQILSNDFKKSLDTFIFGKGFNVIFLHWCDYVRKMFFFLLQHRIAVKFRQVQLNECNYIEKNSSLYEILEKKNQYRAFIECLKIQEEKIKSKGQQSMSKNEKKPLYINMKQKMKKRIQELKEEPRKKQMTSLSLPENLPALGRKQSQWQFQEKVPAKCNRKWSLSAQSEDEVSFIDQSLRKYVLIAMKQYRQVIEIKNPDQEFKKIVKILEGSKAVDT